jgi:SAM-dependent methyltransferase
MHHVFTVLGADPYSRDGRFFEAFTQRLSQPIQSLQVGARVLDASCSLPTLSAWYAESGCVADVCAAAPMESDARIARFLIPGADVRVCRASSLPWQSETFDVIIYAECLECLIPAEVSGTISELRRVLKPGGTLMLAAASTRMGPAASHHRQHFTPESLDRVLSQYFDMRAIEGFVRENCGVWGMLDSCIENGLYDMKPLRRWFNKRIWPKKIAHCDPQGAIRLIAVCKK